jgi:hypothetical protein
MDNTSSCYINVYGKAGAPHAHQCSACRDVRRPKAAPQAPKVLQRGLGPPHVALTSIATHQGPRGTRDASTVRAADRRFNSTGTVNDLQAEALPQRVQCRDGRQESPWSRRKEVLVPTPGDGRRHHSTAPVAGRPASLCYFVGSMTSFHPNPHHTNREHRRHEAQIAERGSR